MSPLARHLSRFRRDERGYLVIETVLALPLLLWGFLALYTYWDAYRAATEIQKAAFAIADMISREQRPVTNAYINGMRLTMDAMITPELDTELRVTSVVFDGVDNRYEVEWSRVSGTTAPVLTTATLASVLSRIPDSNDGDTLVLVETWVDFTPAMRNYGIGRQRFEQFIPTRPRFAPRIVIQ